MKFFTMVLIASLLAACGTKSSDEAQVRTLISDVEAAAEDRDTSDVLTHVADSYTDSAGFDKTQLQNFLRAYFLAHPKLELLVTVESLEFPVDGLAQAAISVAAVELTDPDLRRLKVEFRRLDGGWKVMRADRVER